MRPGETPTIEGAELLDLYWRQRLSLSEIAARYRVHPETIRRRMVELGLARRSGAPPWAGTRLPVMPQVEEPRLLYAFNLAAATLLQLSLPVLPEADWDDWWNIARLAAYQALETYDPGRGVAFRTWAIGKIRFALVDELRRLDHLTRDQRRQAKSGDGDPPPRPLSLDGLLVEEWDEEERPYADGRMVPQSLWFWDDLEERLEAGMLEAALPGLEPRLRRLVEARLAGRLRKEIAASFGVSESRITQLEQDAVAQLQRLMGLQEGEEEPQSRRPPTPCPLETVFRLYEQDVPMTEIAQQCGLSYSTVTKNIARAIRAERLAARPVLTKAGRPPCREEVIRLTREGVPPQEIAARVQVSVRVVYRRQRQAREAGLL